VAASPKIELAIVPRSQPRRRPSTRKRESSSHRLGQIAHENEPVVTSKCASGRPLLTDSAPPAEFVLTHSKQTTKRILTEARTHIRILNFWPFPTQNLAQLIHHLRYLINSDRSDGPAFPRIANRKLTMRRASASRASNAMRGICSALSNREIDLLEPP
jgi:hypothetical protein